MLLGRSRPLRPPSIPVLPALTLFLVLALSVIGTAALLYSVQRDAAETHRLLSRATVYFAPGGSPTAAIVHELKAARQSIHVMAYSFTSAPIAKALVDAKKRGLQVEVILDPSNQSKQYSAADFLAHEGIPTVIDNKHAIAHNKVMIVDGETVLTGSFNFTKAAEEKNAENLLVLRDRDLAAKYEKNYQFHLAHSSGYEGR